MICLLFQWNNLRNHIEYILSGARAKLERIVRRCFSVTQVRNDMAWSMVVAVVYGNEKGPESKHNLKIKSTGFAGGSDILQERKGKVKVVLPWSVCHQLCWGRFWGEASSEVKSSLGHIVKEIFTGHLSQNIE